MNDGGVCRKAPDTPGLLIIKVVVEQPWLHRVCYEQEDVTVCAKYALRQQQQQNFNEKVFVTVKLFKYNTYLCILF